MKNTDGHGNAILKTIWIPLLLAVLILILIAYVTYRIVLQRHADQGDAVAQIELGRSYELSLGLQQDYEQAYFWFSLAVKANGKDSDVAANLRADVAKHLTQRQQTAIDKRVEKWKPTPR